VTLKTNEVVNRLVVAWTERIYPRLFDDKLRALFDRTMSEWGKAALTIQLPIVPPEAFPPALFWNEVSALDAAALQFKEIVAEELAETEA